MKRLIWIYVLTVCFGVAGCSYGTIESNVDYSQGYWDEARDRLVFFREHRRTRVIDDEFARVLFGQYKELHNSVNLYIYNEMTKKVRKVTAMPSHADATSDDVRISLRGDMIAYSYPKGESYDIYIIRTNGRGKKMLIKDGYLPDISPDGTEVAFRRGDFIKGDTEVWIADIKSGKSRLAGKLDHFRYLLWAEDGLHIYLERAWGKTDHYKFNIETKEMAKYFIRYQEFYKHRVGNVKKMLHGLPGNDW